MTVEILQLSQVKVNAENPRTISGEKFQKLVNSILVFPKMLEIRPVVINMTFTALGGNMRTNALNFIAKMDIAQIKERLAGLKDYLKMTDGEQKKLVGYWDKWLKKPTVHAVKAEKLTPNEQQQFIIKDNVSFGNWDYDALANKFDDSDLGDWGMDIWQQPTSFDLTTNQTSGGTGIDPQFPAASEDDGIGVPQDLDSILDNIKAESFAGNVKEASELFDMTLTFNKQDYDLVKHYIEGVTKAEISSVIVKLATEYAEEHPMPEAPASEE